MRFILLISFLVSFPAMAEGNKKEPQVFTVPKTFKIETPCNPKEKLKLPEFFN